MNHTPSARFNALDGLRGIAALLVVLYHMHWPNHLTLNAFVRHGYLAVDLFFVLSGVVISASYASKLTDLPRVRDFLLLRLFRVYPLHVTMLAAFFVLELLKLSARNAGLLIPGEQPFTGDNSLFGFVANVFLIHSLGVLGSLTWNSPSWSISCEFAAYVIFSTGVLRLPFRNRVAFGVGVAAAFAGYGALATSRQSLDVTYDLGIVRCLCGFFLGMAVYELWTRIPAKTLAGWPAGLLSAAQFFFIAALVVVMLLASGGFLVMVVPIFVLLVGSLLSDRGLLAVFLNSVPVQFLGRISYSTYMVHLFVLVVLSIALKRLLQFSADVDSVTHLQVLRVDPFVGDLLIIGFLVVVLAISAATHFWVEEPARLFGRRFVASLRQKEIEARIVPQTLQ